MNDGEALLQQILANPDDETLPLILADWLQEHRAEELAVALRAAVALKRESTVFLVSKGDYSDYSVCEYTVRAKTPNWP